MPKDTWQGGVWVLRLGHRIPRDSRVTTHVALTARAFGATGILLDTQDKQLESVVQDVVARFGGQFTIRTGVRWRDELKGWRGKVVHLTMYGENLDEVLERIPKEDLMVIVGAEKVPGEVFARADYNVAVGSQPHSEVAALAVFLDRLLEGEPLRREFEGRLKVVPSSRGKIVDEG